ncbi:hypothetical protein B0H14DRAFT_3757216 [Mycena olivaceomarginata]|nr:hypothetical protein B0H14DRAFT_3757216 [Mycena olivaceomarginata]
MPSLTTFLELAALAAVAIAVPTDNSTILGSRTETAKRATCTVNSVASAINLSGCTAVIIMAFTVPSGSFTYVYSSRTNISFKAASGATVTMTGNITFAKTTSAGPLITFDTDNIQFNGGDRNINMGKWSVVLGWSRHENNSTRRLYMLLTSLEGTNGGVAKPHPFVKYALY